MPFQGESIFYQDQAGQGTYAVKPRIISLWVFEYWKRGAFMEEKIKRAVAVFMALVLTIAAAMPGYGVSASSLFYTDSTTETAGTQDFQAKDSTVPPLFPGVEEIPVQRDIPADDKWEIGRASCRERV